MGFFKAARRAKNQAFTISVLADGETKAVAFEPGETLLNTLQENRVEVPTSCDGSGTCGTCRVLIIEGDVGERNEVEHEFAQERGFQKNERLACQIESCKGLVIEIPG